MVECSQEIDTFNTTALSMVVMPADDVIFISGRLLGNGVIKNKHTIIVLNSPNVWLNNLP